MMFCKQNLRWTNFEVTCNFRLNPKFVFKPNPISADKRVACLWHSSQKGLRDSFEFCKWLLVENDPVNIFVFDSRLFQTEIYGIFRKIRVVLHSAKAFLFRRRPD